MPLPGNTYAKYKIFCFILMLIFVANKNAFSQNTKFAAQDHTLAKLYAKMLSFFLEDRDSLELYSKKFERDLKRFIKSEPGTMKYDFRILSKDSNICEIHTSRDGNFRIYSWDTKTGGTKHIFRSICQWKSNGKVFTDIGNVEDDDEESYAEGPDEEFCTDMHTVMIGNKAYYLAVKISVGSSRDYSESISAYRIEGEKLLDTVTVFKTKSQTLNSIIVNIDNFNIVDDYKPNGGITYNAQQKAVYIPVVNNKGTLTNKYLRYQLKGRYFEYIGTTAR